MELDPSRLGCRSPLVLAKLGFDMRAAYDPILAEPLPEGLQRLADQIDGYVEWRAIEPARHDLQSD